MKNSRNVFIMGDSYSTYTGFIPNGYHSYYGDDRNASPVVKGVEKTWWKILSGEENLNIVLNDSFSGSTICNTVRENLTVESSFIKRLDKYITEGFFTENKIDTMLVFGGTNDSWINAPIGSPKYSDWTSDDLMCVLPAFCYLLENAKRVADNIVVIINSGIKQQIADGFVEACEKLGVKYLCLDSIDKENGHPTELGMEQICRQVKEMI